MAVLLEKFKKEFRESKAANKGRREADPPCDKCRE
jgi:hypothetical protein